MYICKICNEELTYNNLGDHLWYKHNCSIEDYYIKYINPNAVTRCPKCNKPLKFYKLSKGYAKYCSRSCAASVRMTLNNLNPEFQKKAQEGQKKLYADKEFLEKKQAIAINNISKVNENRDKYFTDFVQFKKDTWSSCLRLLNSDKSNNIKLRTLYVLYSKSKEIIKIGVSLNFDHRFQNLKSLIEDFEIIYKIEGNNHQLLDTEAFTKLEFFNYLKPTDELINFGKFECFDSSIKDKFITYINNYISSTTSYY